MRPPIARTRIHDERSSVNGAAAARLADDTIGTIDVNMNQTYTAVVKQDDPSWIGWGEEVPGVNCQDHTKDDLVNSLPARLVEALEMNRARALHAVGVGYEELNIAG